MNEQIAKQARQYADENRPGSFEKYDPEWFAFYNKKFTELLVLENAQYIEDKFDFCGDELLIAEKLKEHFGVK